MKKLIARIIISDLNYYMMICVELFVRTVCCCRITFPRVSPIDQHCFSKHNEHFITYMLFRDCSAPAISRRGFTSIFLAGNARGLLLA